MVLLKRRFEVLHEVGAMTAAAALGQERTANLIVKGTTYHDAEAAYAAGHLKVGASVLLLPESGNRHDHNAVLILLGSTRQKLGHVSRDAAPKYRRIAQQGCVRSAEVTAVQWEQHPRIGRRLRITYRVRYFEFHAEAASRSAVTSRICGGLPNSSGVYALCAPDGRTYFGSSTGVHDRVAGHVRDLIAGTHSNLPMRRAWRDGDGWTAFLVSSASAGRLAAEEAESVSAALRRGVRLFNLTPDGQGGMGVNTEPVQDDRRPFLSNLGSSARRATPVTPTGPMQAARPAFTPQHDDAGDWKEAGALFATVVKYLAVTVGILIILGMLKFAIMGH